MNCLEGMKAMTKRKFFKNLFKWVEWDDFKIVLMIFVWTSVVVGLSSLAYFLTLVIGNWIAVAFIPFGVAGFMWVFMLMCKLDL